MNGLQTHHALGLVADETLRHKLRGLLPEFAFFWDLQLKGAIHRASELRPSFLVIDIDGLAEGWQEIIIALQSNPATRRIPMLGIARQRDEHALKTCADLAIASPVIVAELAERLPGWVERHARVWDSAYYSALSAVCGDELPAQAQEGIRLFDEHEFWEAHEVLESAWIAVRPHPVGEVYRGILQVGVAYYQIQRGNYRGAVKMFLRAVQWLDPLPDVCQGIDLAQFKCDAAAARAELERLGAERLDEFDPALFKPVPRIK